MRLQIHVDPLEDGFAQSVEPSGDRPFALIRINERFRDLRHAIAGFQALELLRRRRSALRATNNTVVQAEVLAAARGSFHDLPADSLDTLAKMLYDGMSRQLVSVLATLLCHRDLVQRCPEIGAQHRRFIDQLLDLNDRYLAAPTDERYPAFMVTANKRLLVVESLMLSALAAGLPSDLTDLLSSVKSRSSIAEGGHADLVDEAVPLVHALCRGDADALDNSQLALLAARHAGLREDWLLWIEPDGTERSPQIPIFPTDWPQSQPDASPSDSPYVKELAAAELLLRQGDWKAAAKIFGRLMGDGGVADQRVLSGRAEACLQLGKIKEAQRVAKSSLALDASTAEAERARMVLNQLSADKVHEQTPIRMDIVEFLRQAMRQYDALSSDAATGLWREATLLGSGGVQLDGNETYSLTSLPGVQLPGRYLTCLMYVGAQRYGGPEVVSMLGLPYAREWSMLTA